MPTSYITISSETFKKYWSLIQAAIKGYKPIRNYESFVLLETNTAQQTLAFRAANGQGGIYAIISGQDQPSSLTVHADMLVAIQTEELTRVLPFFHGVLDITSVDEKPGEVRFVAGAVEQHLPWSSTIVEDFPTQWQTMTERACFTCPDFGRRLRLGSNSASRDSKLANTFSASAFIQIGGSGISIESAGPTRGVSRMKWCPSDLVVSDDPFAHIIPIASIEVLARLASEAAQTPIVITNDIGGGQIGWQFGGITYFTRTLGERFYSIEMMYGGVTEADCSVPIQPFTDIIGLICAQTKADVTAKATVAMLEDGGVSITSPSTHAMTVGRMPGLCGGTLPKNVTMNARQVVEILSDLKNKKGVVHLDVRSLADKMGANRPTLRISSPDEPEYLHVAVLMSEAIERTPDVPGL